jgi:signal transduction histidine kinase
MRNTDRSIKLKLTGKLMVVMAALLMSCQLILSLVHFYQNRQQLLVEHQQKMQKISQTLSQSIAIDVWNFNPASLEMLVSPYLNDPAVRQIEISDFQNHRLELYNQQLAKSESLARHWLLPKTEPWIEIPIRLRLAGDEQDVGLFRLLSDQTYISAQLWQNMWRQTGELILLILILALGLSFTLSYLVLQPLHKLNAALSSAIQSKDGVVQNPLHGLEDEFEEVAGSIAGLSTRLAQDIHQIRDAKSELQNEKEKTEQALLDLKQTQDALLQSEKQASLGALVAGVAHEVNTPLGVVITSISCVEDAIAELEQDTLSGKLSKRQLEQQLLRIRQASDLIAGNARRAADLINNFKLLAQEQHGEVARWFDLAAYIKDVADSLAVPLARHQIKLQLDLAAGIQIYASPGLYSQIISALLSNVMQHAYLPEEGGECWLRLKKQEQKLWLCCQDFGAGIDLKVQKNVFDPFFTTKLGKGTSGLGLAIVYRIVKFNLKGEIKLHSDVNKGTTFEIWIPDNNSAA